MQDNSRRGRIHAVRREGVGAQLEQRLFWLGLGSHSPVVETDEMLARRLARALRRERRLAGSLHGGYDPVRHLVLARLARLARKDRKNLRALICAAPSAAPARSCARARSGSRHNSAPPSGSRRRAPTWRDIAQATFRNGSSDDGEAT
jgi:hypothetical protein